MSYGGCCRLVYVKLLVHSRLVHLGFVGDAVAVGQVFFFPSLNMNHSPVLSVRFILVNVYILTQIGEFFILYLGNMFRLHMGYNQGFSF